MEFVGMQEVGSTTRRIKTGKVEGKKEGRRHERERMGKGREGRM